MGIERDIPDKFISDLKFIKHELLGRIFGHITIFEIPFHSLYMLRIYKIAFRIHYNKVLALNFISILIIFQECPLDFSHVN